MSVNSVAHGIPYDIDNFKIANVPSSDGFISFSGRVRKNTSEILSNPRTGLPENLWDENAADILEKQAEEKAAAILKKQAEEKAAAAAEAAEKKATEETVAAIQAEENKKVNDIMTQYTKYNNESINSVVAGKRVKKQVLITNLEGLITKLNDLKLSYQTTGIDTSNIDTSIMTIRNRINELPEIYNPTRGGTRKYIKNLRRTRKNRR